MLDPPLVVNSRKFPKNFPSTNTQGGEGGGELGSKARAQRMRLRQGNIVKTQAETSYTHNAGGGSQEHIPQIPKRYLHTLGPSIKRCQFLTIAGFRATLGRGGGEF